MKCILTVAGLGTRLLPLTKEIPKEMLPIYSRTKNGDLVLKPILQVIFESLYEYKIKDFCFIVGKQKGAVENHFTPDFDLIPALKKEKKYELAKEIEIYFKKLEKANIIFAYQPKPIGFGDAIERGEKFVRDESFLVHAGDDIVISKNNDHLNRLESNFIKYDADIAILIEEMENPIHYGIVTGPLLEKGVIDIKELQEKPKKPKSKNTVIAIFLFKPIFFKYLSKAKKNPKSKDQLEEAFNMAIKDGKRMIGIKLRANERRIDIGTPDSYSKVLVSLE